MKNSTQILLTLALIFIQSQYSHGQILCINCYNQNLPVSSNISNMVVNGGFENSNCGTSGYFCPAFVSYGCDLNNWTCTNGGTNTYAHTCDSTWSVVPEGTIAVYMGNWYCRVCSPVTDDTSCIVNEGCTVTGIPTGYPQNNAGAAQGDTAGVSISQTVSGLIPGNVYVLEFWCGGESFGMWPYPGVFGLDLGFGNIYLKCPPTDPGDIGLRYIVQFAATSSSHTLKFTNWGHKCQECTEVILDDIRVYPINQLSSIIPACTLGNEEMDLAGNVTVIQNYHSRSLKISSASDRKLKIVIYNSLSQKVSEMKFVNNAELNLDKLSQGIYVYEITSGTQTVRKDKIIIPE